mmetsp:Transcript_1611/g.5191  ORF Transcript_1611/g.5191 Transcript_1611/m.5191 type:complete len:432 (-) Transcript_1611:21-1316(-)
MSCTLSRVKLCWNTGLTMQSAHPCARKRPASAGGSTSPPPPLRLSATSSPPLPPPPPPPRLPARIAALSRALSVATKTGELPAEARHRITLTAPSTVMRRSVVGTVPGRKAVPAAPSPGRGRGGVDAGLDGPSSRPGLGDECPASNSQPRPHLSAASPGRIWVASRTEAEVDALEGRVTKELPPPRLHRRRERGRRSEERAQQAAEGRGCGAALPGRKDGPRRRPAAGRAGRAIASLFGGEGGVEPDCAHPRSVANHAHPPGGGHRVGAHRPAPPVDLQPVQRRRLCTRDPPVDGRASSSAGSSAGRSAASPEQRRRREEEREIVRRGPVDEQHAAVVRGGPQQVCNQPEAVAKAEAVRVGLWHHRPAGVDKVGGVGSVAMLGVERSVLEQPWRARGVDGSLTATACASPVHGFIDSLDFVGETRGEPGGR